MICADCDDPILEGEDWEYDEEGFPCHSDCLADRILDWEDFDYE